MQEQVHVDLRSAEHIHDGRALVLQLQQLLYVDVELFHLEAHKSTVHGEETAVLRRTYLKDDVPQLCLRQPVDLYQHALLLQLPGGIL